MDRRCMNEYTDYEMESTYSMCGWMDDGWDKHCMDRWVETPMKRWTDGKMGECLVGRDSQKDEEGNVR